MSSSEQFFRRAAHSDRRYSATRARSKFARCWFDRVFRPRDFGLAVALGLAALGAAPAFANGGAGGNDNGGAGGDANGGGGGGGHGDDANNDNGQPGSGGNGGAGGVSYTGYAGGAGGSVGATTFGGVSVTGGTGGNGIPDPLSVFGSGGGGGGGDAVHTGQTDLTIDADVSLIGGNGGHGGEPNRIAGGGGAGGGGLTSTADETIVENAGTITGGMGGDGGDSGGLGGMGYFGGGGGGGGTGLQLLGNGSQLANTGTISGGAGGAGGDADSAGDGGSGGVGIDVLGNEANIDNSGTVTGGMGGTGGMSSVVDMGNGGHGGLGIRVQGNGASLTNSGTITGGDGGLSNSGLSGNGGGGVLSDGDLTNNAAGSITGGAGGAAGSLGADDGGNGGGGVSLNNGALTNSGAITGGAGGAGTEFNPSTGGRGGDGVTMSAGDLTNDATGSISGGFGGRGGDGGPGGDGGQGLSLTGGDVNNAGTIGGGNGGGSGVGGAAGNGGDGARISGGGTLTNDGTIFGGDGGNAFNDLDAGAGGNGGVGVSMTGGDVVNSAGGTIAGGHGTFSFISGAAGGSGGIGLSLTDGNLTNAGTIIGGGSGDGDDGGNGAAAVVSSGGDVNNSGSIEGGFGDYGGAENGGTGGLGLLQADGNLVNTGSITGGDGGDGNLQGGAGGIGVTFNGSEIHNAAGASITGGIGGQGGADPDTIGGAGGIGVILQEAHLVNDGTITGGNAGGGFFAGAGGNGVAADHSTVVNNAGATITGGNGGSGGGMSSSVEGIAGPGVSLFSSTLINHGTIVGGNEAFTEGSGIGAGVLAGNSTVINSGTISGGTFAGGPGSISNAVSFGSGTNRLEIQAGGVFNGNVTALNGNDDTFVLGGSGDGSFDAGLIGSDRQFRGFEAYEKTGTSTWSLTGTSASVTPWSIHEGSLAVNGGLTGTVDVLSAGTLGGVGVITGNVANGGVIAPGNSIGTLLIDGNYAGTGGRLDIEAVLGGDGSSADRLLISGDVSGTTTVFVQNQGGTGAGTGTENTNGMSIIQVGGNSNADAFRLAGQYVAVGPYQYTLNAFAPGSSAEGQLDPRLAATGTTTFWDYRLQSALDEQVRPVPVPQVLAYQALAAGSLQYGWAVIDSLHDRVGEIEHVAQVRDKNDVDNVESLFRVRGWNGRYAGDNGPNFDQDFWFLQTGLNLVGFDVQETNDTLRLGLAFDYGRSQIAVPPVLGMTSAVEFESPALALVGTYQSADGWYIDTVLRGAYYDATVSSSVRGHVTDITGAGLGASVEAGYPLLLAERLILEPQLQVGYLRNWFEDVRDVDGLAVDLHDNQGLTGRAGLRLQKTFVGRAADRLWSPYATADVVQGFLDDGNVTASGVAFNTDSFSTALLFGTGLNAQLGDRWGLYSGATYAHGLSDGGLDYAWTGNGGLRFNF